MKKLSFGTNTVELHEPSKKIIINLANGGAYDFTANELLQLDKILSEIENLPRKHDKISKEIFDLAGNLHYTVILMPEPEFLPPIYVYISKFGANGYFHKSEIPQVREILRLFLGGLSANEISIPKNKWKNDTDLVSTDTNTANVSTKVFLVHGHNDGTKEMVARFIESMGAEIIILHEKPNMGKTIIEKFSSHSEVSYAIVLLTADDKGGSKNDAYDSQKFRARQNVILELGYFIGKLGREKVCCLCEDGVEIPSDFSGVLYIPIDKAGAWKLQLVKELTSARIPLDFSKVIL